MTLSSVVYLPGWNKAIQWYFASIEFLIKKFLTVRIRIIAAVSKSAPQENPGFNAALQNPWKLRESREATGNVVGIISYLPNLVEIVN